MSSKLFQSLKLADFGLAVVVREPLFTVCGTPTYVAPEILAETGYGVKVGNNMINYAVKYLCSLAPMIRIEVSCVFQHK